MADIVELWQRLEAWAATNAPTMLEDLNPGATNEQINELQAALGRELPASFVESLKVHNGESDGWPCKAFAEMGAYHSCDAILENYQTRWQFGGMADEFTEEERAQQVRDGIIFVSGPVRSVMFSQDWIPILDCNGDIFWAIDLDPADGGTVGQIIQVDWEGCDWKVVAESFESFLNEYVTALETGGFIMQDDRPVRAE